MLAHLQKNWEAKYKMEHSTGQKNLGYPKWTKFEKNIFYKMW